MFPAFKDYTTFQSHIYNFQTVLVNPVCNTVSKQHIRHACWTSVIFINTKLERDEEKDPKNVPTLPGKRGGGRRQAATEEAS